MAAFTCRCLAEPEPEPADEVSREAALPGPDSDAEPTDDFEHPLEAIVGIEPLPIYEAKNDPDGRRYAIGEGQAQWSEDGKVVEEPALITFERRAMTLAELAEANASPALELPPPSVVGTRLAEQSAEVADATSIDVIVIGTDVDDGLQVELDRRIATGVIATRLDWELERDILLEERRDAVAIRLASIIDAVEGAGGTVYETCAALPCLFAELPSGAVETIAGLPEVAKIDVAAVAGTQAGPDGLHVRHGAQIKALLDAGWNGEGATGGASDNIVVAVLEPTNAQGGVPGDFSFLTTHGGFRDTVPSSSFRYADSSVANGWRWDCTAAACDHDSFTPAAGPHPTGVTGVILGDLTGGQLASWPDPTDRVRASGYAPEALVHMVLGPDASSIIQGMDAIENMPSSQDPPQIVNMSFTYDYDDVCAGSDLMALAANDLYQAGIAVIAGAGNAGGSVADCACDSPGTAIGSFTIGAHLQDSLNADATDVREQGIYWVEGGERSAWGGNANEGQNRSIISLTAPGRRSHKFNENGEIDALSSGGLTATSLATATVTGAATSLMDYHLSGSTFIDAPGALYVTLLLMGDRQKILFGKGTSNPDHLWGAGRLRVRYLSSTGMDVPWYWYRASVCIDTGEIYDFALNSGNPLPADIDTLKAAAYWYDVRHETSGAVANVNLGLVTNSSTLVNDADAYDNKSWVYHGNAPDNEAVKLRLAGANVNGHNDPVCGANSILVYWAVFAEDNDRESPTYNVATGEGIYPESL